jgi:eukaryotic-like serine/threonine-protein kinase
VERSQVTEALDERETAGRRSQVAGDVTEALTVSARRVVLDRYVLERKLGHGGFGVVWLAFDEKLEREVAVKVIPREDGDPVSERAEREARVAARLNHPGIVALYELAADDEAVYLVSELVPGRNLAELIRHGAVSDRDVARIGIALCDALGHAHQRKVIHRDVKPQNVLVVADPAAGAGFAKLADFGVAHLASGDPLTRTGDVVGTLAYMAPEQAEGERVTGAADVYSLALTLYEAWTGTNPVRASSPMGTARRLGTPLPPLRSRRRDLPEALGRAIDAALDPDPERRPTVRQLRSALQADDQDLSNEGGLVEPGRLERLGLTRVRHRADHAEPSRWDSLLRVLGRLAAGAAAGGIVLGAFAIAGGQTRAAPLVVFAAVALAVAAFPRIAWLGTAAALVAWLAAQGDGGLALVFLVGAAPVPLLLMRAGPLWSLPALAPLLAAAGLGPLYLVVAGAGATAWRRAALGALGFVWLALAESGLQRTLLFGPADGSMPLRAWDGSVSRAAQDAIWPLLSTPALLPAVAWALLAVALPLLVSGRSLTLDLLGGFVWAAGIVAAHQAIAPILGVHDARGVAAGTVVAVVLAVAAAGSGLRRPAPEAADVPRMAVP